MTAPPLDESQRATAAAVLREIARLPPPKRPGAIALAMQALVQCGPATNERPRTNGEAR